MPYRLPTPELETQAHHIRNVRPSRLLVDSLWAIAIRHIETNSGQAVEVIAKAREIAERLNYKTGLALCDIASTFLTIEQRELETATQQIKALQSQDVDDEHIRGWITLLQALLHRKYHEDHDNYDEAYISPQYAPQETINLALRAYSDLVRVSDIVGIGHVLMVLGFSFGELGMTRSALAFELEHYHLWKHLEDPSLLLYPLGRISILYSALSEYEKEVHYLAEGVQISRMGLEENALLEIGSPAWWFQTHYDRLIAPYKGPPHYITYRGQPDVILGLQRLLVQTQQEDEANRAEDALFALEPMSEEMETHVARMKVLREKDALTGLYHRGYLETVLPGTIEESASSRSSLSVLLLDIDDFSGINEKHNSQHADYLLRHVGMLLTTMCELPILPTRYGGDQFLVVLARYNSDAARSYAETVQTTLTQTLQTVEGITIEPFTISMAVTSIQDGEVAELLLQRVEGALNRAKQKGGNRIESE